MSATLTGQVIANSIGGVRLEFDQTPVLFNFNDTSCGATTIPGQQTTCGTGSFLFRVNDVSVTAGRIAPLTGDILSASATQQSSPMPEPATLLLFGTGLAGLGAGLRRRYRNRTAWTSNLGDRSYGNQCLAGPPASVVLPNRPHRYR